MRTFPRLIFCFLSILMGLLVFFYSYHVESGPWKMRILERPQNIIKALGHRTFLISPLDQPKQGPFIATDTITALDSQTFIIAPYYEPRRGPSVLVIAIIHVSVKELYCLFHCSTNQNILVRAHIDLHSDIFGFPYGTADLLCGIPSGCDYTYVSFSSASSTNTTQNILFEVRNHPLQPISANFTVCISTLYGKYNNVLQTIQSIEMYKILGASRVTIYNTSCSRDVDKVLRHYMDEGTLEVVPWPIDHHLKTGNAWYHSKGVTAEVGYFGQTAILNDCLYRNMYKSKFVLLNDIDEIIVPIKDRDWPKLMENLHNKYPRTSVFLFENHVFPYKVKLSVFDRWPHVPGVNILRHPFREPINWKRFNNRKMIVNPRYILQSSIHSALKYRGDWKNIGQDTAITFHCTHNHRNDITDNDLIPDNVVRRYNMSLVPNVDQVVQRLFPHL